MVTFSWEYLTPFQRLMLIKVLHPSMLMASVRTFILNIMGSQFITVGVPDLKEMFEESNAKTPLIFLLSPGNSLLLITYRPSPHRVAFCFCGNVANLGLTAI